MKGGGQQKSLLADPIHVMHLRGQGRGSRKIECGLLVVVNVILVVWWVVEVRRVVVRCVKGLVSSNGVRVVFLVGLR